MNDPIRVLSSDELEFVSGGDNEAYNSAHKAGEWVAERLEDARDAVVGFFSGVVGAFSNGK